MNKIFSIQIEVEAESDEQALKDIIAFCKIQTQREVQVNTSKLIRFILKEDPIANLMDKDS
jgi:hypothetical protein